MNKRKSDQKINYNNPQDFISIACYLDDSTVITKNGHLIQTIYIEGFSKKGISKDLINLRKIVRSALKKVFTSTDFAFWIHTIRDKTNLDDQTPYSKTLSAWIHKKWRNKNYWHDKFVNFLYISIVYKPASFKINNINSFINSLMPSVLKKFHNNYIENALKKVHNVTDVLLDNLKSVNPTKLKIINKDGKYYSEISSLYTQLLYFQKENLELEEKDLSKQLGNFYYALGNDSLEIVRDDCDEKTFASILTIKEYSDISLDKLDQFLQISSSIIVTEVFYFIPKQHATKNIKNTHYLSLVGKDEIMTKVNDIDKMINADQFDPFAFVNHQISFSVFSTSYDELKNKVLIASDGLKKLGLVHIKEDINLENIFWSQIPGNFAFLRKDNPILSENVAGFSSLCNVATGNLYNPWGQAVTLMRTSMGTPYFFNFHNSQNSFGNTCIIGHKNSGKTTVMNFLLSESIKYNPHILYLASDNKPFIFIDLLEGKLLDHSTLPNPFLNGDSKEDKENILRWLKVICNHYNEAISDDGLKVLTEIMEHILKQEPKKRTLENIEKSFKFKKLKSHEEISERLKPFFKGGKYHKLFDRVEDYDLSKITFFNLYKLTEKYYKEKFFPQEQKLLAQYYEDLSLHQSICSGAILSILHKFYKLKKDKSPKILAIDNMMSLFNHSSFDDYLNIMSDKINHMNGLVLSNINISNHKSFALGKSWQIWLNLIDTQIVFNLEKSIKDDAAQILKIDQEIISKLVNIPDNVKLFFIKKKTLKSMVELSLGGFPTILKILSSKLPDVKEHIKTKKTIKNTEEILTKLYGIKEEEL